MINSSHKLRGQGLIETLMVILFISASVVAMLSFQHYMSINTNVAQQRSIATNLAIQKTEILRNFSVVNTTAGSTAYADIANGTATNTIGNTTYTSTWTITNNTTPTYKVITMVVSWTDRNGTSNSITLVTNVAGIDPATSANVI